MDNMFKVSDELYEAVFEYKKAKPWKKLTSKQIFAIELFDGKIGFCSILGNVEGIKGLDLYPSEEDFASYLKYAEVNPFNSPNARIFEQIIKKNSLQFSFFPKDDLCREEAEAIKNYAENNGLSLKGTYSYFHFLRYKEEALPSNITSDDEISQKYLMQALRAACSLAENSEKDRIPEIKDNEDHSIPLAENKENKYFLAPDKSVSVKKVQISYASPKFSNDIATVRIKKAKNKKVTYKIGVFIIPKIISNEDNTSLSYPYSMLVLNSETGFLFNIDPITDYDENAEAFLDQLAFNMIENEEYPETIIVSDDRTEALLKNFCERTNIKLIKDTNDFDIDDVISDMVENILNMGDNDRESEINSEFTGKSGLEDFLDIVESLDDEDFKNIPRSLINRFIQLIFSHDDLPPELESRVNTLMKRINQFYPINK